MSGSGQNYFDPAQLTGQQQVPSGYGNAGSYQGVAVDSPSTWVEFGWQLKAGNNPVAFLVGVDITKTPSGYAVTWTEWSMSAVFCPAVTVTLTSDAFAACTGVTLADNPRNTFPGIPFIPTLTDNTVSLTTPMYSFSTGPRQFQATWLVRCPCGPGVEQGTACCDSDNNILAGPCCFDDGAVRPKTYPCFEARARVWYSDAPWPDWVPPGAQGEVLSWGTEKAWVRVCRGSCAAGACSLSGDDLERCFDAATL